MAIQRLPAWIPQVILTKAVADLNPPAVWLGGGEVLLKLRVPLVELRRTGAVVVACSQPREKVGDAWI